MQQLSENRTRPRLGRILGRVAGALLFAAALCQSDLAHAARMAGVGVFTEAAASMAAASTPARFAADLADFMAVDGTVALRASTMGSATRRAATGTTAGAAGATAGGGVTGSDGLTIHMGRITIRTTATTAPASPARRRIGITAPIPRATTPT